MQGYPQAGPGENLRPSKNVQITTVHETREGANKGKSKKNKKKSNFLVLPYQNFLLLLRMMGKNSVF